MSYIDLFDELNYQFVKENREVDWNLIDDVFDYNHHKMIKCIDWFISNLDPNHNMPGQEWDQMTKIAKWAKDNNWATPTQMRWVVMSIIKNWSYFRRI